MVEEIKIFCDVQITLTFVFVFIVSLAHSHAHLLTLWLFSATAAVAVTDSACLQRLELSLSGPLEKVGQPRGLCHLTDCSYQEEEENVPPAGHKVSAFHHGGFSPMHP